MTQELKACPFCDHEAEFERIGTPRQSTICQCTHCGATLETGEEWDHGRDWNTRPREDALEAELEALKLALMGGEDVPGYAASLSASRVIESHQQHQRDLTGFRESLEAENVRLREALEPFDDALGEDSDDDQPDDLQVTMKYGRTTNYALKLGDLRRARTALGETQ